MTSQRPFSPATIAALVQGLGGGLGWSSFAASLPALREEGSLSLVGCAVAWSAGVAGTVVGAWPGVRAVTRWGARRTGAAALLLGALACAARAVAEGPFALAAVMALFGLHIGFVGAAVSAALGDGVAARELGRASRRSLLAYGLGTLACLAVISALGAQWRELMPGLGVLLAALSVIWFSGIPEAARATRLEANELPNLARNRGLRRVVAVQFLLFGSYLALLVVLPALLQDARLVALWLVVAVAANVVGARWSARLGLRKPVLLVGVALASGGLLGLAAGGPEWLLLLTGLGGGLMAPLVIALPLELPYVGAPPLAAALGVVLLGGQLGGVLLPLLSAAALQHAGPQAAWAVLGAAHLLLLLPLARLAETGPRAAVSPARVDFEGATA